MNPIHDARIGRATPERKGQVSIIPASRHGSASQ